MTEEIPSVTDALNEYFRLKEKFENINDVNKRKIINNPTLSKREKRSEYLKLQPKCINCKRPSRLGTIFSIKFITADDKVEAHRIYKASCGNLADPCNLDIQIKLSIKELLEESIRDIRKEIDEYKNIIINDKNKLLFGLITTETALFNFDNNKSYVGELSSLYENYLDSYNNITDNQEKKIELNDSLVILYENINKIKDCIKKMNENNDTQYAVDAAEIYATTVEPIMKKIRQLKYDENMVFNDDSNNTCRLIQRQISINKMLTSASYDDKVLAFDVGLKAFKPKKKEKKQLFIIESDSSLEEKEEPKEISIKIKQPGIKKIPQDEPIIGEGKDGISWHIPEYQNLWNKLPEKVKNEFKLNIEWMKSFMYKCLNKAENPFYKNEPCSLTSPPNLIIPPRFNETTKQYDFGVLIYNKVFDKLPQSTKETYLSLYKEDPSTKAKDYSQLEDALNNLIARELNFTNVYV